MSEHADVLPPRAIRPEAYGPCEEERIYAGPHTKTACDWLGALEASNGALARAGADRLLGAIDTRRFQLTVTPGAVALTISFHAGGRRTVAAQLRRDNALVELALRELAEVAGPRAQHDLCDRLEALAPAWFRWSKADGNLPGLGLAACADEQTAEEVAVLLDGILVDALRAVAPAPRRWPAEG